MVKGFKFASSLLTATAVALKIFPLGMTVGLLVEMRSSLRRALLLGAAPVLAGLLVIAGGRYVSDLRPNPVGDAFAAFHFPYLGRVGISIVQGADVQPQSITFQIAPNALDYVLGAFIFVLAVAAVWWLALRRRSIALNASGTSFLLSSMGLILFSYLTGANFDYRLTFLVFVLFALALASRDADSRQRRELTALGAGFAAVTWLSVTNPLAVQLVGDALLWICLVFGSAISAQALFQIWREAPRRTSVSETPGGVIA
jgi:hypothetical protein